MQREIIIFIDDFRNFQSSKFFEPIPTSQTSTSYEFTYQLVRNVFTRYFYWLNKIVIVINDRRFFSQQKAILFPGNSRNKFRADLEKFFFILFTIFQYFHREKIKFPNSNIDIKKDESFFYFLYFLETLATNFVQILENSFLYCLQ